MTFVERITNEERRLQSNRQKQETVRLRGECGQYEEEEKYWHIINYVGADGN